MTANIVAPGRSRQLGIWVPAVMIVCALAVMGWVAHRGSHRAAKRPTVPADQTAQDEVARLRGEMKALRSEVMSQRAMEERARDGVHSAEAVNASAEGPRGRPSRESVLAEQQAQVEAARQRMEVELDSQSRDRAFESSVQEQLRGVYQAKEFAGTHFESVECRATLCRVRSQHDNQEAMRDFTRQAAQHAPFNVEAFYSLGEGDAPISTVYFARPGSSLPHDF
jgi:hypothetical protein